MARSPIFGQTQPAGSVTSFTVQPHAASATLWPYQCIDTMKVSRDRSRQWEDGTLSQATIQHQVAIVKSLGANCIAIDTPYDEEFYPYLSAWVAAARTQHLHIWFRGSFSGWEGWFDYNKSLTPSDLLAKTQTFIYAHPTLFANGDIFTPAPEAENGGPFQGGGSANFQTDYRTFLTHEYQTATDAFAAIHVSVTVSWLSMSGGVAKSALDSQTLVAIGNTATIDHYVKSSKDMADYINYFANLHATVVLGEFGAPIPDLNGSMTATEQATFVQSLMQVLYSHHTEIGGVNYWVLTEGSTAILNPDGSERKVAEVIRDFYLPATISGTVTNTLGAPITNLPVVTTDRFTQTATDDRGHYTLVVPAGASGILIGEHSAYIPFEKTFSVNRSDAVTLSVSLKPQQQNVLYRFLSHLKQLGMF